MYYIKNLISYFKTGATVGDGMVTRKLSAGTYIRLRPFRKWITRIK